MAFADGMPPVPAAMVGNPNLIKGGVPGCSQAIHDLYNVVADDGQAYRTWHALWHPKNVSGMPTLQQIANGKSDPACYFAHEHGDPPLALTKPGASAPLPAFGYAGIRATGIEPHAGFKVVTHLAGQKTGWHHPEFGWESPEFQAVDPDWDFQIHFHQGVPSKKPTGENTPGATRITQRFHEISVWVKDDQGRVTHVRGMGDTGIAEGNTGCGVGVQSGGLGRRLINDGCFVSPANIYENWSFVLDVDGAFGVNIDFDAFNGMDFVTDFSLQKFGSASETICGDEVQRSGCAVKRPFGDPDTPATAFMATSRNVLFSDRGSWEWSNAGGTVNFCTDPFGVLAACGSSTIPQTVAPVNRAAAIAGPVRREDSSHFPLAYPFYDGYLRMPQGAPLGN